MTRQTTMQEKEANLYEGLKRVGIYLYYMEKRVYL